jgi:hypothetical protein
MTDHCGWLKEPGTLIGAVSSRIVAILITPAIIIIHGKHHTTSSEYKIPE